MGTLKWIGKSLGKKMWRIAVLCVTQCFVAITGVVFALIMRQVIDCAVAGQQKMFWQSIIAMIVLIVLQITVRWIERYISDDTAASIENTLRLNAFQKMLRTDYGKMKEYHTGELMNLITSDTYVVTDGALTLLPTLVAMGVRVLGVLLVLWIVEPKVALLFLAGGILVAVMSTIPRKWQKRAHKPNKITEKSKNKTLFGGNYYEEVCLPRLRLCSRSQRDARRFQVPPVQGPRLQVQGPGRGQAGRCP